jgi:hypothetical protein
MVNRLTVNLHCKVQSLHEGTETGQGPVTRWMISSRTGTVDEPASMPELVGARVPCRERTEPSCYCPKRRFEDSNFKYMRACGSIELNRNAR